MHVAISEDQRSYGDMLLSIVISNICDCGIFYLFNRRYERKNRQVLRGIVFLFASVLFVNTMNWFGMEIAYRGFAGTAFYAIVFYFVFENVTLKTAAIRAIELMGCTVVAELSVNIILMLQVQRSDLEGILEETLFWAIALVIARSCELIFLELVNSLSNNKMDKKWIAGYIVGAGFILGYLYFMIDCLMEEKISHTTLEIIFIINILLSVTFLLGYIFFLRVVNKSIIQENEIKLLSEKARVQMDCYEEINNYKNQVQRIFHDLKNQMLISREIETEESKSKYLDAFEQNFHSILSKVNSGNEILDLLIQKKAEECKRSNIDFQYDVEFTSGDFINLVDVGVIFGNIIDNAIESCERLDIPYKKIILCVVQLEEFIVIKIQNPVQAVIQEKNRLITLKKDKDKHGWGMLCLEEALKKYDGNYRYKAEDKVFALTIFIPIKQ